MKMKLLVLGVSLFLVGCSNGEIKKDIKKEPQIIKVDKNTKEKADKFAKDFTENTAGDMEMVFNVENNSFDIKYVNEELSKVVKRLSENLEEIETFNTLVVLAQKAQESTDIFKEFDNKISVDLENPNDKRLPLYSITEDSIKYPASEKAFNGELPNELSKNMDDILKTVNFSFQPKGIAEFNQQSNKIVVKFNMTDEELNYSNSQISMRETLKKGLEVSYNTIESVYSEKYDIVLTNKDKEFMKIKDGIIE